MAQQFDYVVIGAGSAGCCLAARLSESGKHSVCLIEAGPVDSNWRIKTPVALVNLMRNPRFNWMYSSAPQEQLQGRQLAVPRGKTLGGSSAINSMVYIRGRPSDYDNWARLGCEGWDWESVLPYFRRAEKNLVIRDKLHGDSGPLIVSDLPSPHPLCKRWVSAGISAGIPYNRDFNGMTQDGLGTYQVTMFKGRRCSSANAYLEPAKRRDNLAIMTDSEALRINCDQRDARSVTIEQAGQSQHIGVRKELLLCAGSIGSPALLMASGIGPEDNLQQLGIRPVHVLSGVGRNLQEHPSIGISTVARAGRGLSLATLPAIAWSPIEYWLSGTGLFSTNHVEAGGFARTQPDLTEPDIQFHMIPARVGVESKGIVWGRGYFADACLLRPKSRGRLTVRRSEDRFEPHIDYALLSHPDDRERIVDAFQLLRTIMNSEPFQELDAFEESPGKEVRSREEIFEHCKRRLGTAYHPVGTCRMGSPSAETSVVDPDLKVLGLNNVRVVDASVMPEIIGGNTNAPTIMLAERASDLILSEAR